MCFLTLTYADSNGVWILASDVEGDTFGSDEGNGEFNFPNNVNFDARLVDSQNNIYYLDLNGNSQVYHLLSNELDTNKLEVNGGGLTTLSGDLVVSGTSTFSGDIISNGLSTSNLDASNLTLDGFVLRQIGDWSFLEMDGSGSTKTFKLHYGASNDNVVRFGRYEDVFSENWEANVINFDLDAPQASLTLDETGTLRIGNALSIGNLLSCSGKLYTDSSGQVICGTDNVNDADADANNEKPLAGNGILVSDRSVSINAASCSAGQYSYWDGDSWECSADVDTNTQLSEAQVDAYVSNNGYLTSYTDTNTQLNEAQVDAYVSNNGYLTSYTDTNAATICSAGYYLRGDGVCIAENSLRTASLSDLSFDFADDFSCTNNQIMVYNQGEGEWKCQDQVAQANVGNPYVSISFRDTCTGYDDVGTTLYMDYTLLDGTTGSKLVFSECVDTWSS